MSYQVVNGEELECIGIHKMVRMGSTVTAAADSARGKASFVAETEDGNKCILPKSIFRRGVPAFEPRGYADAPSHDGMEVVEVPGLMRPKYATPIETPVLRPSYGELDEHACSENIPAEHVSGLNQLRKSMGLPKLGEAPSPNAPIPHSFEQVGPDVVEGEYTYKTIKFKQ